MADSLVKRSFELPMYTKSATEWWRAKGGGTNQSANRPGRSRRRSPAHQVPSPLFVHHGAVLNRVDAGVHGSLDTIGAFRVCHDFLVRAMSNFDRLRHLLFTEFLHVEVTEHIADAAGRHQFDPVCAVFQIMAYSHADFIHVVGEVREPGGTWGQTGRFPIFQHYRSKVIFCCLGSAMGV